MQSVSDGALYDWTRPPAKPTPYPIWQRLGDQWQGRRDGRKGIPYISDDEPEPEDREPGATAAGTTAGVATVPAQRVDDDLRADTDPPPPSAPLTVPPAATSLNGHGSRPAQSPRDVGTARLEELRRIAREQIELEWLALEKQRSALEGELTRAIHDATVLAQRVDRVKNRSAEIAGTKPDLTERRVAERDRSEHLVHRRRRVEHERRVSGAEQTYLALLAEHRRLLASIASLEHTLGRLRRVAAARARRVHEHACRRVAVYWQQLVLAHKRGPELNARLRPVGPDLPAWATEERDDSTPRDSTPRDSTPRDSTPRDSTPRDSTPRDGAAPAQSTAPELLPGGAAQPPAQRAGRGGGDGLAEEAVRCDGGPDETMVGQAA